MTNITTILYKIRTNLFETLLLIVDPKYPPNTAAIKINGNSFKSIGSFVKDVVSDTNFINCEKKIDAME